MLQHSALYTTLLCRTIMHYTVFLPLKMRKLRSLPLKSPLSVYLDAVLSYSA